MATHSVRVLLIGNCAEYTPGFLTWLVARSNHPQDRVSLCGVICPVRFGTPAEARWFAHKRRIGRLLGRLPSPMAEALRLPVSGVWQGFEMSAIRAGAAMLWPTSLTEPAFLDQARALAADVVIVAGLNRILKEATLAALPPAYNVHPSLLPEFRGATPEFWQVDSGATEGGVTLHRIDAGIDTGPIVLQRRFALEPWLDSAGLLARSVDAGTDLLREFLSGYPEVVAQATTQSGGSSQPAAGVRDHAVPWQRPAEAVVNRARAVGWGAPLLLAVSRGDWGRGGAMTAIDHEQADDAVWLRLYDPRAFPDHPSGAPGQVQRVDGGGITVSCNPGTVFFGRVETAGSDGKARLP